MRYRDDYERPYDDRGERYGSRGPRQRDDRYDQDMDRGAPEFSGGYICENCGSDDVAPRRAAGRGHTWGERDDYGHRDDFDRGSRMGVFDVPDAGYRRPDDDYSGYRGREGYRDHWRGSELDRDRDPSARNDDYRRGENRWTSSERPMTRDSREQNREYYGSDHGFRDYDRYSEYEHDREGRGGRNRR